MNTQKPIVLPMVLATLISAILFGGLGYYLSNRTSTTKISPIAMATPDSSAKTYTNAKHAYTIEYPNDWTVDTTRSSGNEIIFDIGIVGSRESIKVEAATKTLDQWAKGFDEKIVLKTSDMTIGGLPAKQVETSEFGMNYIGVKKDTSLYTFTTGGRMIENGMLASFKFIQTASPDETTSWTTYTNKQFGFTVRYPNNWKVDDTDTASGGAEGIIAFYKEASITRSPSVTITINAAGRGVKAAEINYDIAYENDVMKITNRRIITTSEMGKIVKGKVHFWNNYGSNIELKGGTYYITGENLSNQTDEDEAVDIVSSFMFIQ